MSAEKREQIITVVVVLALVALFIFGLVLPRTSTLGAIKQEQSALRESNRVLVLGNEAVTAVHQEADQLRRDLEIAQSRIPVENHFSAYENNLLKLGEQYELWTSETEPRVVDTTIDGDDADQGLQTRSMRIDFTAGFEDFYNFLRAVESQDKLTRIDGVDIARAADGGDKFAITLELRIFYGEL